MKKTIRIDIAGQLFSIDEDAFDMLSGYLQNVTRRFGNEPGGEETINDIETRIAEIFGGGQEPPVVVGMEMITNMISIMGTPEDYFDEDASGNTSSDRSRKKSRYDNNSFIAKTGRTISSFRKTVGKGFYLLYRGFMILAGSTLSLMCFALLFSFVLMLFFNNTALVKDLFEPEIFNLNTLLSIVLNTNAVLPIIILSAIVIILPLAALIFLGIKMVFNLKGGSRVFSLVMFITWIISTALLGVILSARLGRYADQDGISKTIELSNSPDTIYLSPGRLVSSLKYDEMASVDQICFFRSNNPEIIYGSVDVNLNMADSTVSNITISKKIGNSSAAHNEINNIDFSYKYSGDTLYIDEYFSLKPGMKWNGAEVNIWIDCQQGTIVKCVPESNPVYWNIRSWNHEQSPLMFKIDEDGYEEIIK